MGPDRGQGPVARAVPVRGGDRPVLAGDGDRVLFDLLWDRDLKPAENAGAIGVVFGLMSWLIARGRRHPWRCRRRGVARAPAIACRSVQTQRDGLITARSRVNDSERRVASSSIVAAVTQPFARHTPPSDASLAICTTAVAAFFAPALAAVTGRAPDGRTPLPSPDCRAQSSAPVLLSDPLGVVFDGVFELV
jgi:hypothetical protein